MDKGATVNAESSRTNPDFVVYAPRQNDASRDDGLNEHFLVFDGPDGSLMAVWTQSLRSFGPDAGRQHNHIMFSRSGDEGYTWQAPTRIAGPSAAGAVGQAGGLYMASWAFPMVSEGGRIYVIYNQNQGVSGWIEMHTGTMAGVYSDDGGKSWSSGEDIPMPKSPYDDPKGKIPPEWIVWQRPHRDRSGGYFVGYSHWVHPDFATLGKDEVKGWTWIESVVEFMRFTNVDAEPSPKDLSIRYSSWGENALRVPHYLRPNCSVAQEPSFVRLPDERLFCVMRTCTGYIWWSESNDDGETWCSPRPLLDRDFGRPLLNPVASDPIYRLSDGRYLLLYHNHRGETTDVPASEATPRNPLYIALGEFRPGADQAIWFSDPKLFMDTGNVAVDGKQYDVDAPTNATLSMYSSFTTRNGKNVLWYPDRKTFLLGKRITKATLSELKVPD